jgi:teichuronic acid exporter
MAKRSGNIAKTASSGAFWMLSATMTQQLIRFFLSLILARILIPADFGTVALVLSIYNIVQIFSELGISVAVVQRKSISDLTIDSAFILTFVMATLLSAGLWFYSELIARFFEIEDLDSLLHVVAISIIFRTLFSFYHSLMLRDLRYKAISAIEAACIIIYGISAIFLAIQGFGPLSIVIGQLIYSIFALLAGIILTRHFPKGIGSLNEMYQLFKFGIWVLVGKFIGKVSGRFDRFVIGKLLDVTTLGGYYLAINLAAIIPNSLIKIPKQVMLPIFSRWQDDPERLEKNYWRMIRLTCLVGLPICVLIAVLAEPLILILYGQKWHGITPLLRVFTLYAAAQCFGGGLMAVIYGSGNPHLAAVLNGFRFIFLPAAVLIGSTGGIMGIAWGVVVFEFVARLFNHGLITWSLKFSFLRFFKIIAWPIVASAGMALVGFGTMRVIFTTHSILTMVLSAAAAGLISIIFYIAFAWRTMPEETLLIINEVRGRFKTTTGFGK